MKILRSVPAALAALLLGAHFFRAHQPLLTAACVVLAAATFVPVPLVRAGCRAALAAGTVVWLLTAFRIARQRLAGGQPYLRMLVILGAVACLTALAAWMLRSPRDATPDA